MPGQHRPPRHGIKGRTPRTPALPEPGIGGYDYPRGPYGATGFPGSTPAALRRLQHSQRADGRKDPSFAGTPTLDTSDQQEQWATLPRRTRRASTYRGGNPELVRHDLTAQQPKSPWRPTPGVGPAENGRAAGWDIPARLMRQTTGPEHRMIPDIGANAPGSQNVRNTIAQRYKARPELWRPYRPSPNPGKTGARLMGPAQYHPGTMIYGDPEGGPVPRMPFNPDGTPPTVTVLSRFSEREGGAQEGYAMNRPMLFAKGGTPAPQPHGADPHIRGARMSGQRYFGALRDQQRIGLDSDSFGIVRARGPRHRPVRFETPVPHAANFYDVAPEADEAPDMIHRSPMRAGGRARADPGNRLQPGGTRQTSRRPRRG